MDEGLDHGSRLDLAPRLLVDLFDGTLDLLDLDEGGVGEGLDEGEGFIDSGGGGIEFFNLGFIVSMFLFSEEGVLSDGLSVEIDVLVDGVDSGLDLLLSRDEEVIDDVFHSGDISLGVLDVLF